MTPLESIRAAFDDAIQVFDFSPAIRFLQSDSFNLAHYKSYLRQTYHYTKENPQLQALAAVYLRGCDRQMVRSYLRHAISEVGHDLAALADLKVLGEESQRVFSENPLPATSALTAFAFYQINYKNPVGYLGYLYFLEHMPTKHGATYAKALIKASVPDAAMGFLKEHMRVDIGHNRLMDKYLAQLLHDQKDADAVIYAIRVTAELYANMLWSAVEHVQNPIGYGVSWVEADRLKTDGDAALVEVEIDEHGFQH